MKNKVHIAQFKQQNVGNINVPTYNKIDHNISSNYDKPISTNVNSNIDNNASIPLYVPRPINTIVKNRNRSQDEMSEECKKAYKMLGAKPGDSLEEIRKKFRLAAIQWHPDLMATKANKRMKQINKAMEIVSNEKRNNISRELRTQNDCNSTHELTFNNRQPISYVENDIIENSGKNVVGGSSNVRYYKMIIALIFVILIVFIIFSIVMDYGNDYCIQNDTIMRKVSNFLNMMVFQSNVLYYGDKLVQY
eukprot:189981_1